MEYESLGDGLYNLTAATLTSQTPGGAEGIVYVPLNSSLFTVPSLLLAEFNTAQVSAYEVDANGDPESSTRTAFVTGVSEAQGAVIDPLTGDFLFTEFVMNQIVQVQGFAIPPPPPPVHLSSSSSSSSSTASSSSMILTSSSSSLTLSPPTPSSSSSSPVPGGVVGDPQFMGLRGQSFQVHGMDGAVYNLIVDNGLFVNARFGFRASGRCPAVPEPSNCWSHPGSYLDEVGVVTAGGSKLRVASGSWSEGFRFVALNGVNLSVGTHTTVCTRKIHTCLCTQPNAPSSLAESTIPPTHILHTCICACMDVENAVTERRSAGGGGRTMRHKKQAL